MGLHPLSNTNLIPLPPTIHDPLNTNNLLAIQQKVEKTKNVFKTDPKTEAAVRKMLGISTKIKPNYNPFEKISSLQNNQKLLNFTLGSNSTLTPFGKNSSNHQDLSDEEDEDENHHHITKPSVNQTNKSDNSPSSNIRHMLPALRKNEDNLKNNNQNDNNKNNKNEQIKIDEKTEKDLEAELEAEYGDGGDDKINKIDKWDFMDEKGNELDNEDNIFLEKSNLTKAIGNNKEILFKNKLQKTLKSNKKLQDLEKTLKTIKTKINLMDKELNKKRLRGIKLRQSEDDLGKREIFEISKDDFLNEIENEKEKENENENDEDDIKLKKEIYEMEHNDTLLNEIKNGMYFLKKK